MRRLPFEGAQNFRDIGGYPTAGGRRVRWGVIYRSDNLGAFTDSDLERFSKLGIKTIVDFRVPFEREHAPSRLPDGHTIRTVEVELLPEGGVTLLRGVREGTLTYAQVEKSVTEQYRRFVSSTSEQFRLAIECALDPTKLPLLIHCTSGKDRTGFAIAVLLMALGVDRDTIADDYALTNDFRRNIGHLFSSSTEPGVAELLTTAQRAYLDAAYAQMEESYGSVDAYLRDALGLTDEKRSQLIETLTE